MGAGRLLRGGGKRSCGAGAVLVPAVRPATTGTTPEHHEELADVPMADDVLAKSISRNGSKQRERISAESESESLALRGQKGLAWGCQVETFIASEGLTWAKCRRGPKRA